MIYKTLNKRKKAINWSIVTFKNNNIRKPMITEDDQPISTEGIIENHHFFNNSLIVVSGKAEW